MLERSLHRFSITTPEGEEFKILRPIPKNGDPWGDLACLKGSQVGQLIPVLTGDLMSHALHGNHLPLIRKLGRPPRAQLRMVTGDMTCALIKSCAMADRSICYPCAKLPHCYVVPGLQGEKERATEAVLRAWADGRYVVVVEGPEFSL